MRQTWSIHGGVHPAENKVQSTRHPISFAGIPELLIFPLSQHIGAPSAPIVKPGDRVLKGQMIAEARGLVSASVHASTSGEVIAIESRTIPHPSGMQAPCILIKPDGRDEWIAHAGVDDYTQLDKSQLLAMIRAAGIAGMGGAGFPSAVKLGIRDEHRIETLIINGTECEPYITADDMLMREQARQIIEGARILRYLVDPSKETLIGVEDNKQEAIGALRKAAEGSGIEVVAFPTKYPSGGEKQLIQILTGKEVPAGKLPADIGIVCQNIGTTVAIKRAVRFGEPLISRITTVTGKACREQRNFEVLLGTPVSHLLALSGFDDAQCPRLIMGGPMMGYTLTSTEVPIVKTSNCVLAPTAAELPPPPPAQACIRCGMCAEACPVSLLPQQMYWFARGREYDKLEAHNLMDCIECGACSYACPSNIPLVQYYRASKADIRQQKVDQQKAEASKLRFEARQARVTRLEEEKEAKRQARRAAAAARDSSADSKVDAVQAAIARAAAKKSAQTETAAVAEAPAELDPAQAAIARAQAKRAGGASEAAPDRDSLEKALATAQQRLQAAQQKLAEAQAQSAPTVGAMQTAVEKMQAKLEAAEKALADFVASTPPAAPVEEDPAQRAIARAMAQRAASSQLSDAEKQQQKITGLEQRLQKAREKLAAAEASGDANASVLADTVSSLDNKLREAQNTGAEKV